MTLSLYQASVPVYARRLEALSGVLDKAIAYAGERKIDHSVLLKARLFPDMFALDRQVRTACGHALRGSARLTGKEPTSIEGEAASLDDLKAWIAHTIEVIEGVDPKLMDGMGDRDITFPSGGRQRTMRGADYLLHFSMPNFYFHVTTAYAILRHNGVDIGKDDFMGGEE
jgi:hypothetical protein